MKMNMFKPMSILLGLLISFGMNAHAALSPVGIAIVPPVQFPPSDFNITGLRLSVLAGSHRDVSGIDLAALGNITNQKFTGAAFSGLFNYTRGQTTAIGFQIAGLTNYNLQKTNVVGFQAALGMNYNKADSDVAGVMLAAVNLGAHTDIYGLQVGVYNRAKEVHGIQIGLVNVADSVHGLQIGLINFHYTGLFYVSPVINFGF